MGTHIHLNTNQMTWRPELGWHQGQDGWGLAGGGGLPHEGRQLVLFCFFCFLLLVGTIVLPLGVCGMWEGQAQEVTQRTSAAEVANHI